ncbi:DUF6792 domain-containing protein [Xanthomonas theicola]|uniref:Uncharacterized protein n=1 Tax=Xanthomonas theicola TaxID=56464 RepID=A0A2S6ZL22_9XANT|nr:DUF6792 domain-containing protein [Xanthomonas theicola]PPT92964.1 hypothetical protein XthCFBP4691_01925 [Xanthomonas theicola]QNH23779.1 hypothetical protein G4Q83_01965 [Xanthomonas theicola]
MSMASKQYAALAFDAYYKPPETGEKSKPVAIGGASYKRLSYMDSPSGYQGILYQRLDTNELIVAHRGTEPRRELISDGLLADGGMVATRHNTQAADAIEFTQHALEYAKKISKDGKVPEVTVAGHSLGGTLAQVTAHHFDLEGETFNAYGAVSLHRRISEGGHDLVNHVMAGDPVSAASQHYGQVRLYATHQEIATLQRAGYDHHHGGLNVRNPLSAASGLVMASHSMNNLLPEDEQGKPHHAVLEDPAARQLAQHHAPMIARYRDDVASLRLGMTLGARGWGGLLQDGIEALRGPLAPGAGRDSIGVPTWSEHMQRLHDPKAHGAASQDQGWHVPLRVSGESLQSAPAAPVSLHDDPAAFLDRMLAAAQSGDRTTFRQMTQALANEEPGRALRAQAIATVDQQQAAQQALQAQQQADRQQQEMGRDTARAR